MRRFITILLVSLLAFPSSGLAVFDPAKNEKHDVSAIGERDVDGAVNFYSLEKEIAFGKQLAEDVERHSKIVDDPVISEYVNRVAQNIARNSDLQVPLYVKVIDSDEVNAFALPGGYFFVNTGLINLAESEAELAGVMAHEIAHIAARHGTRQASQRSDCESGDDPIGLPRRRLGGIRDQAGGQFHHSGHLPEVLAELREGSRPARDSIPLEVRLRPDSDDYLLRAAPVAEKEERRPRLLRAVPKPPADGEEDQFWPRRRSIRFYRPGPNMHWAAASSAA